MELADPQEGVSTPVEAKAPPSFARLTDLTDGSPLKTAESPGTDASEEQPKTTPKDEPAPSEPASRTRHKSHEPEYNPWGA